MGQRVERGAAGEMQVYVIKSSRNLIMSRGIILSGKHTSAFLLLRAI